MFRRVVVGYLNLSVCYHFLDTFSRKIYKSFKHPANMQIIHQHDITGILEGGTKANLILKEIIRNNACFRNIQILDGVNLSLDERWKRMGINNKLEKDWRNVLACLDYNLYNKSILDLGCGATNNNFESKEYSNQYEPWLCRALHSCKNEYKTQVMGVDCGDLSKEEFPHKELNLLEKEVLINNFEKNSFDLINASMLFTSPELEFQTTKEYRTGDASEETAINLKNILLPQIKLLLKSNGIFLYAGGEKELFKDEPEFVEIFRNSKECRDWLIPPKREIYAGQY
jgi:SAM-dependent methyltransferase